MGILLIKIRIVIVNEVCMLGEMQCGLFVSYSKFGGSEGFLFELAKLLMGFQIRHRKACVVRF